MVAMPATQITPACGELKIFKEQIRASAKKIRDFEHEAERAKGELDSAIRTCEKQKEVANKAHTQVEEIKSLNCELKATVMELKNVIETY